LCSTGRAIAFVLGRQRSGALDWPTSTLHGLGVSRTDRAAFVAAQRRGSPLPDNQRYAIIDCQSPIKYFIPSSDLNFGSVDEPLAIYECRTCHQILPTAEKAIDPRFGGSSRSVAFIYFLAGTKRAGSTFVDDGKNKPVTGGAAERACIHWDVTKRAGLDASRNIRKIGRGSAENAQCSIR
jgi:hypothetical protein